MKWFFIFKFLPIPVFYTDKYLKLYQAGRSLGIFAIIRTTEREHESLHAHELEHCKQFYITTLMWVLGTFTSTFIVDSGVVTGYLYALAPSAYFAFRRFIPLYRYDMEIAAFNAALNTMNVPSRNAWRKEFARSITSNYNLNPNKYTLNRVMKDLM